jgi:hypothetical protein
MQRVGHIPFEVWWWRAVFGGFVRETFRDGSWGLFYLPSSTVGDHVRSLRAVVNLFMFLLISRPPYSLSSRAFLFFSLSFLLTYFLYLLVLFCLIIRYSFALNLGFCSCSGSAFSKCASCDVQHVVSGIR